MAGMRQAVAPTILMLALTAGAAALAETEPLERADTVATEVMVVTSQVVSSTAATPARAALAVRVALALAALAETAKPAVMVEARVAALGKAATAGLEFDFSRVVI
jgi:hypothetical protein